MQAREIIEEYRPARVLKTSPWSTVFLAADPRIGDDVVLKLIAPASPIAGDEAVGRFQSAVEAVRSLPGASVPPIRDLGITPDQNAFLVMDVVGGVTLAEWPTPQPARAIRVLLQILGALEVLASAGVAHLNLREDNILVNERGLTERVRLLGFGTGAFLAGAIGGVWPDPESPEVPPEILPTARVVRAEGWRSDLFSLATVACRLLGAEVQGAGSREPRVTLEGATQSGLADSSALVRMLERALNLDPMARGRSLNEVRDALIRSLPEESVGREAAVPSVLGEGSPYETFRVEKGQTPSVVVSVGPGADPDDGFDQPVLISDLPPAPGIAPPPTRADEFVTTDEEGISRSEGEVPGDDDGAPYVAPVVEGEEAASSKGRRSFIPRKVLVAASAAAAVVLLVFVALILTRSRSAPSPQSGLRPTPIPTAVPTPEPDLPPPTDPRLAKAQALLLQGDAAGARSIVEALRRQDTEAFSEDERSLYEEIRSALGGADRERAIRDLRNGLDQGSVRMLRRGVAGVAGLSRSEVRAVSGLEGDLARGREALTAHQELWAAQEGGDSFGVIEHAAALDTLLPEYSAARQLRDQAAASIRAEAEAAIEAKDYQGAIALLDRLHEALPDLAGVEERITWCRDRVAADREQQATLDHILAIGEAGDLEGALRALDAATPNSDWQQRYQQARRRLEAQLAELDAGFPVIELPDGFELAYRKNDTLVVPLKVTDDYRVQRVVVLVKTANHPEFREIQLEDMGEGSYPFEVGPELHENDWVQFYVVATDPSGHETRLGGPQGPLTIVKKKWYQK